MQLKPITAITVFLLVVASLLIAGCTQTTTTSTTNQTTFSSNRGYNITYPEAWAKDVNTNANTAVELYIYINPNNTLDAVDVATAKLNATTGTTLQRWLEYNTKDLSQYSGYTLQSVENTTLAGQLAYKEGWQATVPAKVGATSQNAQLKVTQVFLIRNGTGYVITYKAIPDDYNTYLAQAQEVINSFKFTP